MWKLWQQHDFRPVNWLNVEHLNHFFQGGSKACDQLLGQPGDSIETLVALSGLNHWTIQQKEQQAILNNLTNLKCVS